MRPTRLLYTPALLRTTAFRIIAAYVAVFSISISILGGAAYFAITGYWTGLIRDQVTAELDDLLRRHGDGGLAHLAETIDDRASDEDLGFVYLLQDADGRVLAGRLPSSPMIEDWHDLTPPWEDDDDEPFIATGRVLADGHYLSVGHDAEELHDMIEFLLQGLAWTFAIAIPLALLGGMFVSAISLRRVETINRATLEIRRGDLTRRIPLVGANDEFDRLAGHINAMLDGIEDLTDGLRQVSQDIAHDLRTPLTRVRRKLELAVSTQGDQERHAGALDDAIESVDVLQDAFSALLRIAQIESGTRKTGFKPFDLSDTLRRLVEDYEVVAQDGGRTFTADIAAGVTVVGDQALVVQMIVNLIENAIRHTPTGTEIRVAMAPREDMVRAVIADDGPGIPEASKERLFRRFYRLDKSRHTAGSGLGLSLVAAVARLHGIEVKLEDNRPGLKVMLDIPIRQASGATTA